MAITDLETAKQRILEAFKSNRGLTFDCGKLFDDFRYNNPFFEQAMAELISEGRLRVIFDLVPVWFWALGLKAGHKIFAIELAKEKE